MMADIGLPVSFADVYCNGAAYTRFHIRMPEEDPTQFAVRDWHPTAGNVIWKQEQLGDDSLEINGFWADNVVRPGRYTIRLLCADRASW